MSELTAYIALGYGHIVSIEAVDHLLFLVALAAAYRWRDWRPALAVVSAFTVGHSVTLALAATRTLLLPSALVEVLIPLTIVATCAENLRSARRATAAPTTWHRPALAALFGLVHGAGFAGYLQSLMLTDIVRPLLGFNIGIELGQVVVLTVIALVAAVLDAFFTRLRQGRAGFAWRVVSVSAVVMLVAGRMAWERLP
jgi:hypothetical protein